MKIISYQEHKETNLKSFGLGLPAVVKGLGFSGEKKKSVNLKAWTEQV